MQAPAPRECRLAPSFDSFHLAHPVRRPRLALRAGLTTLLAAAALTLAGPSQAQDAKLPSSLTVTAYDTGSSGFNIAVAVGKMMKERNSTDVRVLPGGNDIARLAPLKGGRAQVSAMGVGAYFAQEGVFEFGVGDWGPQALQLMLSSTSCNSLSLGVAKDTGVKEIKDLRGKRIGFVVGSPALNQNALAILAYGGLTRNDVKIVEFSSYGAMWKGLVNNEADAAFASTISGQAREVDASPRGLIWPEAPAADKAAWERVKKVGPYFYPHPATCGAGGLNKESPKDIPAYPYPVFVAYASQPVSLIHGVTKSMIDNYADYKSGAPGADGLELKRQNLSWVLPYHAGAVQAFKEAGAWTAEAQAHNDGLLKRQATLASAWSEYTKASPPSDKDAFYKGWIAKRKDALVKAGMDPIFE
jgi:TRAP transporter TAXI family solute receptor